MVEGTLAVQLYSVREHLRSDRAATLRRIAELGLRYVEPFGLGARGTPFAERMDSARRLRADLDAAGLGVCSTHAAVPDDLTELARECAELGTGTVFVPHPSVVPGFDQHTFSDPARVDAFADMLTTSARRAAEQGLRFGYHNHWFEWARLPDGTDGFARLFSAVGDELLAEVDLYWAASAGVDPSSVLGSLGDRVTAVHLKDGPARPGEPQSPIGTGTVDIRGLLSSAKLTDWHVLEIDSTDLDPFDLLARNARTLVEAGLSQW